jgi:hypothetical protein
LVLPVQDTVIVADTLSQAVVTATFVGGATVAVATLPLWFSRSSKSACAGTAAPATTAAVVAVSSRVRRIAVIIVSRLGSGSRVGRSISGRSRRPGCR